MKSVKQKTSLLDRCGVAFLSFLAAFITSSFVYMLYILVAAKAIESNFLSFKPVLLISLVFGVIGFAFLENVVIRLLSPVWNVLEKLFPRFPFI